MDNEANATGSTVDDVLDILGGVMDYDAFDDPSMTSMNAYVDEDEEKDDVDAEWELDIDHFSQAGSITDVDDETIEIIDLEETEMRNSDDEDEFEIIRLKALSSNLYLLLR